MLDKIMKDMGVVTIDGRQIGVVSGFAGADRIRLTSHKGGHGYDHVIPAAWVEKVDRYVHLCHSSRYVADNWEQSGGHAAAAIAQGGSWRNALPANAAGSTTPRKTAA